MLLFCILLAYVAKHGYKASIVITVILYILHTQLYTVRLAEATTDVRGRYYLILTIL